MQNLEKQLQRLTFKIMVKGGDDTVHKDQAASEFTFIYGIGSDGLSDFEMAIDGLGVHETHHVELDRSKLAAYFGWLSSYLKETVAMSETAGTLQMDFTLQTVSAPKPREIVSAMADLQGHGGCGSGCGCGCH